MAVKRGRFGFFLACTGYPRIRNTKRIVMKEGAATAVSDTVLEEKCPECGSNLVLKHGRYGQFTACSNYPKCKYVKRQTLGFPVRKKAARVSWWSAHAQRQDVLRLQPATLTASLPPGTNPVNEPCPNCGHPLLLEKHKKDGRPSATARLKAVNTSVQWA